MRFCGGRVRLFFCLQALGYVELVENEDNRPIRLVQRTAVGLLTWNALFKHSFELYRIFTEASPRTAMPA